MKYYAAVIEDNPEEANRLIKYIEQINAEGKCHFETRWFPHGGEFLMNYQPVFDVVLMDIQLGDSNGMDLARGMRQQDINTPLIFVTSLAQYAVRGYEVSALDFIIKPVQFSSFRKKLFRAAEISLLQHGQELVLNTEDGIWKTSANRIRYIEIFGHSLSFHTLDGILNTHGTLKNYEHMLDPNLFVRCNRSCLVNLSFVYGIRGNEVHIDSEQLPLSRYRRNDFISALNRFIGGIN